MALRKSSDRLNVIGVSGNPNVLQAISEAAKSRSQIVQVLQLGTDLSELPTLLEQIDLTLSTVVFLEHPPVPTPELLQAAEQIQRKDDMAIILILAERDPGMLPMELLRAGFLGLLTPPFHASVFADRIRRVVQFSG